jgi:DNA-binding NtrC family response regulator
MQSRAVMTILDAVYVEAPEAKGFVGKPFDMRSLLRAVRDALDKG